MSLFDLSTSDNKSISSILSGYFDNIVSDYTIKIDEQKKSIKNAVFRCYPYIDLIDDKYSLLLNAKEIRTDKKYANNNIIIRQILSELFETWSFSRILNNIKNYSGSYYSIKLDKKLSKNKIGRISSLHYNINEYITGNILDIGAGNSTYKYLKRYFDKKSVNKCYSTDNDIIIVLNNFMKYDNFKVNHHNKNEIKYRYFDFNNKITNKLDSRPIKSNSEQQLNTFYEFNNVKDNPLNRLLSLSNDNVLFDTIFAYNCINFAFKNNLTKDNFRHNIDTLTNSKCKIIIRFMDYDLFNTYLKNNNEYIERLNEINEARIHNYSETHETPQKHENPIILKSYED